MPCTVGQQRYYNLSLCQNTQETKNSSSNKSEISVGSTAETWDVGIWTGLGWPRIETGGGRL